MKLTLEELRVDSYSTQVSETELTETKGGVWTTPVCADIVIAGISAVAGIVVASIGHEHDHCDSTVTTTTNPDGSTSTHTDYHCNDQ